MFFCVVFLFASLMSFLPGFYISACDPNCAGGRTPVCSPSRVCCRSSTPRTLYQPPNDVSIRFVDHTGPMFEGGQYTVECKVQDVAPVKNLVVTLHRGETVLGQLQSKLNQMTTPVTESYTFNINPRKEDDAVPYWCEAKLELGPEATQRPPVVKSQHITASVYYKPQLKGSSHLDPITITEGTPLHLNCLAEGNPTPSYTWMGPSNSMSLSNSSDLTIDSATSADEGSYTCVVTNDAGTATVTFNVVVQYEPSRLDLLQFLTIISGVTIVAMMAKMTLSMGKLKVL